jgi:hypothetical protein
MKKLVVLFTVVILGLLSSAEANGQIRKIMHQTFELSDSIQFIQIDILDRPEVTFWPGNKIMLETNVKLENASPGILEFLISEQERYVVDPEKQGEKLLLISRDNKRHPVRHKGNPVEETIVMRLFVPDEFVMNSENQLRREE